MEIIRMIVYTVLILGILVFAHEFGHFFAAKCCGIKVKEFALGMGPLIFKKQGAETLYSIRVFPLGGYCSMQGEDNKDDDLEEDYDPKRSFNNKALWQQAIVLVAGPAMNVVVGLFIAILLSFMVNYSHIAEGGMEMIVKIIEKGLELGIYMVKALYESLLMLFSGQVGMDALSGPVGIGVMVGEAANEGIKTLLYFISFFSMNLAVMNLLPLPALDGGRLLFTLLKAVTKGKWLEKIEASFNFIGLALLLMLMLFITFNDIWKYIL